jgi:cell division protease FtsH
VNNLTKNIAIWLIIAVVLMTVFNQFGAQRNAQTQMPYSQFIEEVRSQQINKVVIVGNVLRGEGAGGKKVTSYAPNDPWLVSDLLKNGVSVEAKPEEQQSLLMSLLISWFPMLLLIGVWVFFMRQMQGGGKGGAFSFGKSRARLLDENANPVTFADVAGCDEAKEEVAELVDFLKDPTKFQKLGGRIPRGVLLVGSPGTGKTLLARAISGEAKVPFYSISGSDFVEMFVGVGASRVRDMFEQAKKTAPCIIFIDEIDAVGRQRGAGLGGGNDEREQTLNQLLVEMDGFEGASGVIVIAATNRPDVLDPALLRPGRFDRQVVVSLPDIRGREQILLVHMRKVPIAPDVRADILARGTRLVDMYDFEKAKDKIFMGAERKSMVITPEDKKKTAYHESGHAVIGMTLPGCDPVHKVSVIPRGRALGVTWSLPEEDRFSLYRDQMLAQISMLFGGRVAEEIFVGNISTGASNDFERATQIAREMVTRYGMSEALGPMVYGESEGEVFLGRSVTTHKNMSEATMQKVDIEIRRILDEQYALATKILTESRSKVEAMTNALMEWETIDADQIADIMADRVPRPPKPTAPPAPPSSDDKPSAPAPTVQPAEGM